MRSCVGGCLGRVVAVVLLVGAAAAAWIWGPELYPPLGAWLGRDEGTEPTPELAETTLDRLEGFQAGEGPGELSLSAVEIESVVRFALPGILPRGVDDPDVVLEDGRILLTARVSREAFPDLPDLGSIVGVLPDTVPLEIGATLASAGSGRAHLVVHSVKASRIPLPSRLVPHLLDAFGREDAPRLAPNALLVPLPGGLASAWVAGDSLVLSRVE